MTTAELRRRLHRAAERLFKLEHGRQEWTPDRPPFGLEWMHRYLPHYVRDTPSQLHRDLAADLRDLSTHRGQRRNWVAPRSSAKTTWLSKAYPLYGALEGIEPLTLLTADASELSQTFLDAIKTELELNPAIRRDYPQAAGKGPVWQARRIRLRNGCEIVARGAGGRVLGLTARARRPTLVVVDDGNKRNDAYSPMMRKRRLEWFAKDILPIGEPDTNFIVAGTAIHREALVCQLRAGGWTTRSYKALLHDPNDWDLWQAWERLLTNLSDPHREQTARAFYDAHRSAMDAGCELLWPERLTLYQLMVYRCLNGEQAFKSEYQDDPGTPEGAEWPAELFDWPGFWFDDWPPNLELKIIALDPSKGADAESGDWQAHALLGLHKGTLYLDAVMKHETPEEMCLRTCEVARAWFQVDGRPVDFVVVEDNGTMGLIGTAVRLATERAKLLLPWESLTQTDPKPLRIRKASPYLHTKRIRVRNTPGGRMLVEQWREFPFGSHDDGPDAAGTAIRKAEEVTNPGR